LWNLKDFHYEVDTVWGSGLMTNISKVLHGVLVAAENFKFRSLPYTQQLAIETYPEPDEDISSSPLLFLLRPVLTSGSHIRLEFQCGLSFEGFPTKTLYVSPMHFTYPAHPILLGMIIRILFYNNIKIVITSKAIYV
jgi:hypothetical protein